jgi:hypothetical protein
MRDDFPRTELIALLRRVLSGGTLTHDDLMATVPDSSGLPEFEKLAWLRLGWWADDEDIRARDQAYADMRLSQIEVSLEQLEALESGGDPLEVEVASQAIPVSLWGCLLTLGLVAVLFYLMFANGFFMHGDR